jgi:excisionase family DNA binding protein
MTAMPQPLYDELTAALTAAHRLDLVERLRALWEDEALTSKQAASLLGVSSANTVKNWLEGGWFPGAYRTPGGHWRFLRSEVLAARERMEELRDRNARRDLAPPDVDEDELPLL